MSDLYIPPNGLYFRLVGYASLHVLFSRTHAQPEVGHTPVTGEYPDQFFTLVPGTGERTGLYLIQSKTTNVLFSRTTGDPKVWHVDGEGNWDDNWFKLVAGTGNNVETFRLLCPATKTVIYSRVEAKPEFLNYPSDGTIYPDQHFSFLFEAMQVDKIDYDVKLGKVVSSASLILASKPLKNDSDKEQEMKYELDESVTHTSTFEYSSGFTVALGAAVNGGVPFTTVGEIRVDSTASDWKYGEANSFTKKYTASVPVKVGPRKTVRVVSVVNKGKLEVPYTISLSSKSAGVKVETKGIWYGVSTWDLRHTIFVE